MHEELVQNVVIDEEFVKNFVMGAKIDPKVEMVLMETGFCGNSLGLIMGEMCWDGIEQRGTWHETDGGYLWILVVWTLDPVGSETMLLTDTCTL